jgi:hypothetical protein
LPTAHKHISTTETYVSTSSFEEIYIQPSFSVRFTVLTQKLTTVYINSRKRLVHASIEVHDVGKGRQLMNTILFCDTECPQWTFSSMSKENSSELGVMFIYERHFVAWEARGKTFSAMTHSVYLKVFNSLDAEGRIEAVLSSIDSADEISSQYLNARSTDTDREMIAGIYLI